MKDVTRVLNNPPVYFIHFPNPTDEIFFKVCIPFGNTNEKIRQRGVTHILEHYLLGSMHKQPRFTHPDVYINGEVSALYSNFSLLTHAKTAPEDINLFLRGLYEPDFSYTDIFRYESQSTINELQESLYSLENEMGLIFNRTLFSKNNPYYDSEEEILRVTPHITLSCIKELYTKEFRPTMPFIFIGGKNLSKNLLRKIVQVINTYDFGTRKRDHAPFNFRTGFSKSFKLNHIISGNYVLAAFPTIGAEEPLEKRLALRVACETLGGKGEHGLFMKMREQGIYSFSSKQRYYPQKGLLIFKSFVDDTQLPKAFDLFYNGIEKIKNNWVDKKIIEEYIKDRIRSCEASWKYNTDEFEWIISDILFEKNIYSPHILLEEH